jgi:hypothetical protein
MPSRSFHAAALVSALYVCPMALMAQTMTSPPGSAPAPAAGSPSAPPLGSAPPSEPAPTSGSMQPSGSTPTAGSEPAPSRRPSRGNGSLFGADDSASSARARVLDLTVSASSAYDDDLSEGLNATSLQAPVGGAFSDLTAALALSRKVHHSHIGVRATNSMRHYPSLHRFVGSSYSVGTDFALDVTRRTGVQASADVAYVSEFAFDTVSRQSGLGNVALSATGLDIAALDGARLSYGGAAGLTRKVGTRSVLTLSVGAHESERRAIHELAADRSVGGYFSRIVGRDTSIGLGYNVRSSSQRLGSASRPAWSNDAHVAVERRWRHPGERRTVVSLSAGPSLLQVGLSPAGQSQGVTSPAPPPGSSTRVIMGGSAAVNHEMSRSWSLGTSYRRGAGSIDGLVSNSASLDLHGLLNRRLELAVSAGYFASDLGLAGIQSRYTSKYASGRLQVAVTRTVALFGQYLFYDYAYGIGTPLPGGIPLQQQRRGARAGLTLWVPLREGHR